MREPYGDPHRRLDAVAQRHFGSPVSARSWTNNEAASLLRCATLEMLVVFHLGIGSCRSYIRSAAQYISAHGASADLHHITRNPGMRDIWASAKKTLASHVKRAAIVGLDFLQEGAAEAERRGTAAARQHAAGLVLSFFYLLRISEFAGDGNAAGAGPLRASDISFYAPSTTTTGQRVLLSRKYGKLASVTALRVKGSKGDAGAQGATRCAAQPDRSFGIDLAGMVSESVLEAEARGGRSAVLLPDVNYQSYDKFIKCVARNLGLDPTMHTSHIGRRSAASRMAAAGLTEQIQAAGRWSSDAWQRYVEQCVHLCEGTSNKILAAFTFVTSG